MGKDAVDLGDGVKVYYVRSDDFRDVKVGYLTKIFEKDGIKWATVRENVDKYREEHFHDIPLWDVKQYVESDEIRHLNHVIGDLCSRLEDLWSDLKDIKNEEAETVEQAN